MSKLYFYSLEYATKLKRFAPWAGVGLPVSSTIVAFFGAFDYLSVEAETSLYAGCLFTAVLGYLTMITIDRLALRDRMLEVPDPILERLHDEQYVDPTRNIAFRTGIHYIHPHHLGLEVLEFYNKDLNSKYWIKLGDFIEHRDVIIEEVADGTASLSTTLLTFKQVITLYYTFKGSNNKAISKFVQQLHALITEYLIVLPSQTRGSIYITLHNDFGYTFRLYKDELAHQGVLT